MLRHILGLELRFKVERCKKFKKKKSFTLYLDEKSVHPESFSLDELKIISDTNVE